MVGVGHDESRQVRLDQSMKCNTLSGLAPTHFSQVKLRLSRDKTFLDPDLAPIHSTSPRLRKSLITPTSFKALPQPARLSLN